MSSQRRITFLIIIVAAVSLNECVKNEHSEIANILHRPIRSLTYPSNSGLGLFFALAVPLPDTEHSISMSYFFEANYNLPTNFSYYDPLYFGRRMRRSIDRGTVYQVLENKFESAGFPGRECLLRSICETSEWPIRHNGILGDVMHVILTPSSSQSEDLSEEYAEAEQVGRNGTCSKSYSMCPIGLFDIIGTFVDAPLVLLVCICLVFFARYRWGQHNVKTFTQKAVTFVKRCFSSLADSTWQTSSTPSKDAIQAI